MDEIISDLEKLIDDKSIYSMITKTDIKKIIDKYKQESFADWLKEKYNGNVREISDDGFSIVIVTEDFSVFDVKCLKKIILERFKIKIVLERVEMYPHDKTIFQFKFHIVK